MGKNDDMECDGNKLEHLVKKLIPYQHHPHFSEVCLNSQTIPEELQKMKILCIRTINMGKHGKILLETQK